MEKGRSTNLVEKSEKRLIINTFSPRIFGPLNVCHI